MQVAIVGAGPAGAFCGERLARAGARVTLFDPSHPREKPCGGGVTPAVFRLFPELGSLRRLARPARSVRLRAGARAPGVAVELPEPIEIFSRERLDGALLARAAQAGARLEPARVRRVRVSQEGAWLELAGGGLRRFDFVVGADGAASAVRRSLLGARPGGRNGYATAGFHVEGLPEDEIFVEFLPDMKGYLWVFPRPGHASVGIAAPAGRLGGVALRARVAELLGRAYPGSRGLARLRYAASIPSPDPALARRGPLGGPRFALAGDAAGQVDAITGEGIHHALHAAALVAEALLAAGPLAAGARYEARWRAGPGRELALAARWARRWYTPRAVAGLLALGARSRRGRRIMGDLMTLRQPYATLLRRCARELVLSPSA